MSDRITKQNLQGMFEKWCKTFGFTPGYGAGEYYLACNFNYGGYVVERKTTSDGVSQPITGRRRNTREMWDALYFAVRSNAESKYRR